MEKKTALAQLEDKINERITYLEEQRRLNPNVTLYIDRANELRLLLGRDLYPLKPVEREQIEDAYKADLYPCSDEDAAAYFNQTYKQE
jgi:hypothetical protein